MASLSFDPAAHFYDATRGYPEDVAQKIAHAIDGAAGGTPRTAYLEVGVGTGRIALPLTSLGRTYTGVDISEKMLAQLEAKLLSSGWQEQAGEEYPWGSLPDEQAILHPIVQRFVRPQSVSQSSSSLRLVISDIKHLPFLNASFDAIVAVHIFHLIDGWQQALQEVVRVLRPGGKLLQCWDTYDACAIGEVVNAKWHDFVQELGGSTRRPGGSTKQVKQWLGERGFQTKDEQVLTWQQSVIPRQAIDYIAQRYWSSSWQIPDDIFAASIERLESWGQDYFGSQIDVAQVQERLFFLSVTQL